MLPIQFIFLLMLVSLPGQLALEGFGSAEPGSGGTIAFPLVFVISFVVSQMVVAGFVWFKARRAIRVLHVTTESSSSITHGTDSLFFHARWATIAITGVHLFATPIADYVVQVFAGTHLLKHLLLPELLFLTPALGAWVVIWTAAYFVESAVRERALPYRLAQQLPVHEMPSLGQFFKTQARHNFFPALFLFLGAIVHLVGILISDAFPNPNDPKGDNVQAIASVLGSGIMFVILPFLLVRFWSTTPLTGPLRERFDIVAATYRLRFRNILLWRTHHLTINAAILGWVPFARYFLLSDSLLESFSDKQLEAVFAHEVGHGVHRHLHWFIAVGVGALLLASGVGDILVHYMPLTLHHREIAEMVVSAGLLIVFAGVTIPFISPRFEHQADWFACRHMASVVGQSPEAAVVGGERLPVELQGALAAASTAAETVTMEEYVAGRYPHTDAAADGSLDNPVAVGTACAEETQRAMVGENPAVVENAAVAGAEVFVSALDTIVESSHRDRRRRGLMHPSIEDRITLLRRLAVSADLETSFNHKLRRTRYYIVAMLAAGVASCIVAQMLPGSKAGEAATQGVVEAAK